MTSTPEPEPLSLADARTPKAKWGTAGEYCYCTTGSSDYCEFCDSWVGKCWCWDEDADD